MKSQNIKTQTNHFLELIILMTGLKSGQHFSTLLGQLPIVDDLPVINVEKLPMETGAITMEELMIGKEELIIESGMMSYTA